MKTVIFSCAIDVVLEVENHRRERAAVSNGAWWGGEMKDLQRNAESIYF